MNPQILQYINSLVARINSVSDCRSLTILEQEILANMQSLLTGVENQIASLAPFTTIPTNLAQVIQWIENYIGLSFVIPYQNALLLEAQLITSIEQLTAAINNKYANLSCIYHPVQAIQTMGNQLAGNALIGGN